MSALVLKMAADFLGIKPEEIAQMAEDTRQRVFDGVNLLQEIADRLHRIEDHLGINDNNIVPIQIEGNVNVKETGTGTE